MTVSKASLSKVQYTTPIADLPDAATINSVANAGTSRGYNNGAATVSYTAKETGGTTVTFTATSTPGSYTASGTSPITVEGLQSNTSYTFKMTGTNASGTGAAGAASSSITATTVPQAPTVGTPTITSATEISLPFTAGATGGSAITSYTITSSPSIALTYSGTTSPFAVTGSYVAGTEYTFNLSAENANGLSTAGTSSGITPNPQYSLDIDFLVVAGGGNNIGGGGGYRTSYGTSGKNSSAEAKKSILSANNYTVTVGAAGQPGTNSVFSTITSLGGGGFNQNGGSGGGGIGQGTANQGNNGGSSGGGALGGGGGAGQVGGDHGSAHHPAGFNYKVGGTGGNGLSSTISGSTIHYAGGGGGSGDGTSGSPRGAGTGGGSTANRGGGGSNYDAYHGGDTSGGSGVVILRHDNAKTSSVGAGLTASSTTSGGDKIITFTAGTGNVSWS